MMGHGRGTTRSALVAPLLAVGILALIFALGLAGCQSVPLDARWAPLESVDQRPALLGVADSVITTLGTSVYTIDPEKFMKRKQFLVEADLAHEQAHAIDQGENGPLFLWVLRYLISDSFRLAAEQRGHAAEIRSLKASGQWHDGWAHHLANRLSGDLYDLDWSFEEALAWVRKTAHGRAPR